MPTEAEWEKSTRGGLSGKRFGWGNLSAHSNANYYSWNGDAYDVSPTSEHHPVYNDGVRPYSSPVGSFAPNRYGLFDMAGNMWEWGWDWYDAGYYASSPSSDPTGVSSGSVRVSRGGYWGTYAGYCRSAIRWSYQPSDANYATGFRVCLPAE